jgi:hypothetical protein
MSDDDTEPRDPAINRALRAFHMPPVVRAVSRTVTGAGGKVYAQ